MAAYDDILAQIPVSDIAAQVGIDEATASAAIGQLLPGLLGGMKANADTGGASSLASALADHSERSIPSIGDIDVSDGKKIVRHVFGDKEDDVTAQLASAEPAGLVSAGTLKSLLPILAPIVLGLIGKKIFGGSDDAPAKKKTKKEQAEESSGGLGDLLGGILGGATSAGSGSGGFLGGILGGLLSGGTK